MILEISSFHLDYLLVNHYLSCSLVLYIFVRLVLISSPSFLILVIYIFLFSYSVLLKICQICWSFQRTLAFVDFLYCFSYLHFTYLCSHIYYFLLSASLEFSLYFIWFLRCKTRLLSWESCFFNVDNDNYKFPFEYCFCYIV